MTGFAVVSYGVGWEFFGVPHCPAYAHQRYPDCHYQDLILTPFVRPYTGEVGPGPPCCKTVLEHVAGVSQQFLEDKGIDSVDNPACSPDLSPFEHIWNFTFHSIHQRHIAPQAVGRCFSPDQGGSLSGEQPSPD